MFLHEAVTLSGPLAAAQSRLDACLQDGAALQGVSEGAFESGLAHLRDRGLELIPCAIDVVPLPAYLRGVTAVVLIRWLALPGDLELAPPLDANLELGPGRDTPVELALVGSYHPPLAVASGGFHAAVETAGRLTANELLAGLAQLVDERDSRA